jgi:hypothetical protein
MLMDNALNNRGRITIRSTFKFPLRTMSRENLRSVAEQEK